MPLGRPYPIDKAFPNGIDLRRQQSGMTPREGLLPDPVTVATDGVAYGNGGWNVGARPFVAVGRRGTAAFAQTYGSALITNDSAGTAWTIDAAPTSGSRIDLLWVRLTDPTQGEALTSETVGGVSYQRAVPVFGKTTGTPGTTPAAPALPAGALEVARVTTPSSAASIAGSTIAQTYRFAHVLGGPVYARTVADLPTVAFHGEEAVVLPLGRRYTYSDATQANAAGWFPRTMAVALRNGADQSGDPAANAQVQIVYSADALGGADSSGEWTGGGLFTAKRGGLYTYTFSARANVGDAYFQPWRNRIVVGPEFGAAPYARMDGLMRLAKGDTFEVVGRRASAGAWAVLGGFTGLDIVRVAD